MITKSNRGNNELIEQTIDLESPGPGGRDEMRGADMQKGL